MNKVFWYAKFYLHNCHVGNKNAAQSNNLYRSQPRSLVFLPVKNVKYQHTITTFYSRGQCSTHPQPFLEIRDCRTVLVRNQTRSCDNHWGAMGCLFTWSVTQILEKRHVDCIAQINALVSFQVYREAWYHGVRAHFSKVQHSFLILHDSKPKLLATMIALSGQMKESCS